MINFNRDRQEVISIWSNFPKLDKKIQPSQVKNDGDERCLVMHIYYCTCYLILKISSSEVYLLVPFLALFVLWNDEQENIWWKQISDERWIFHVKFYSIKVSHRKQLSEWMCVRLSEDMCLLFSSINNSICNRSYFVLVQLAGDWFISFHFSSRNRDSQIRTRGTRKGRRTSIIRCETKRFSVADACCTMCFRRRRRRRQDYDLKE